MTNDSKQSFNSNSSMNPPVGDTKVGIVRKRNIEDMVRAAIDLAGGLGEIKPGNSVVIKPNITWGHGTGGVRIVTSPDVLRAVIRSVKENTDKSNITVADACAFRLSTLAAAKSTGLYQVCMEEGVTFLPWEREPYISFSHESYKHIKRPRKIPASLPSFDHFINLPILKNHEMVFYSSAKYTCCIKNFVGVIHPLNRADIHTRDLGEKCAELNLCVPEITMNIVDALTIILTMGPGTPYCMKTADSQLILASKDRVACDSMALAVLKLYASKQKVKRSYVTTSVWEQAQVKHAAELGLGRSNPDRIKICDDSVDNIDEIVEKWC